jgi:hypothetical protein
VGYATAVRGLVAAIAAGGRLERVEGGGSKVEALLAPVLFAPLAAGAIALALFALPNAPWWGRLAVPAVPVALFTVFRWLGLTRHWPRPLGGLADLAAQLPPDGRLAAQCAATALNER